jgi:hypothetical protein
MGQSGAQPQRTSILDGSAIAWRGPAYTIGRPPAFEDPGRIIRQPGSLLAAPIDKQKIEFETVLGDLCVRPVNRRATKRSP